MLYGSKPDYCCNEMETAVVQGEKSFNVCNGGKTWECRKKMGGANTSCWGPFGKFTNDILVFICYSVWRDIYSVKVAAFDDGRSLSSFNVHNGGKWTPYTSDSLFISLVIFLYWSRSHYFVCNAMALELRLG